MRASTLSLVILGIAVATRVSDRAPSSRAPIARSRAAAPASTPAPPRVPAHDRRGPRADVHRAGPAELAVRNRIAGAETAKLRRRDPRPAKVAHTASPAAATSWLSLGPTNVFTELDPYPVPGVDSGRPSAIVVDRRDPSVVYVAVSGGGVWKTSDLLSPSGPTWTPLTDGLPNLAVGALAIDDGHPDTLYLGNGDFLDGSGNTIVRTTDGGTTWDPPVVIADQVRSVRSIGVRGAQILAGTDAGLFASSDGGASFQIVDLPNSGQDVIESIWSVLQTGGGHWVASGVTACDPRSSIAPLSGGQDRGPACALGNNGEIWTSADGISWTQSALPRTTGTGRITLAVGPLGNPNTTVVYAFVGSTDGMHTVGFWRSDNGGDSWVDATGTLANPTASVGFPPDCGDLDLGHQQTWYNQAIVVDPTSADHVAIGGDLCGARTLHGTADAPSWELVSHWLFPGNGRGATQGGALPYVHADWHTATTVVSGGTVRTFVGSDGGLFSSTDVFTAARPETVSWAGHNQGLVTHLAYSVGSGDPTTANPFVLLSGLQDNGTRIRVHPDVPAQFNQPVGGDGIGTTIHVAASGTTFWASREFGRRFCQPSVLIDCTDGKSWSALDPVLGVAEADDREAGKDAEPFFVHYANVETDPTGQSVLTHTTGQVFVAEEATGTLAWRSISQDLTGSGTGFSNVTASRTVPGLYGAAGTTAAAPFFTTTSGNATATWTAAQPVIPPGGTAALDEPSSMDFPPVTPPGSTPGAVFLGAFAGTLDDALQHPPPDDQGRLYRTTDGGATWTSIAGADPDHRLPNVAIYVVKYDPITPATIYAGTDLGVYRTTDDGATWDRMGEGLPMVPVRDLYVAKNQEFLRIATFGRGLWEIFPSASASASAGASGDGDYDRNQALDWIDLAALSSRIGDTPASTSPPWYSWLLDLTAAADDTSRTKIDDADLLSMLSRFGGHP